MTDKMEIYKCKICGNIVQVLLSGAGELVCCNEKMELLEPKFEENDSLAEKHTPVLEKNGEHIVVSLRNHPMVKEHYIEFIETYTKDKKEFSVKYFEPDETPIVEIQKQGDITALELCNIHGLWRSKND